MFMVLLGGTTTGKTFHYGPRGVLVNGLVDALGEDAVRGMEPVLSVEVSPVPGGRGSTLSIDYYGASVDLYPRREAIGWIDMPGQDYLVSCPVFMRIERSPSRARERAEELLGMLLEPGRPAEIVEALRGVLEAVYSEGLMSVEAVMMGLYGIYTDFAPGRGTFLGWIQEHFDALERRLAEMSVLDGPREAWALVNAAAFHLVYRAASDVRRDLRRRRVGTPRFLETLRLEEVLASTLARAYLEAATHASARDLYPSSLEAGARGKACIGPGCPAEAWPHRHVSSEPRIYSGATAALLEHRALIAGPIAGLLQLALAGSTGLHAIAHPADKSFPAARYLERSISMRSGLEGLERIRLAARMLARDCSGRTLEEAVERVRSTALQSVSPVRVIQSLARQECPQLPPGDPARILGELAGAEIGCDEEAARLLGEIEKHYTYTGALGDLAVSHSLSIEAMWRISRRPPSDLLVTITYADLAGKRLGTAPWRVAEELAGHVRGVMSRPDRLDPFPLRPPRSAASRVAVVPGGSYECCRSGPCNPALTIGYLASLMAAASE